MDAAANQSSVVELFLTFCPPTTHQPLDLLACDEFVRDAPPNSKASIVALRQNFPEEILLASGLIERNAEGELVLRDALAAGRSFVVLVDHDSQQPIDLLMDDGCLSADTLPVLRVLSDHFTNMCLTEDRAELFVAFDLKDVLLLRACGWPATLANGLSDIPLSLLGKLSAAFGRDWEFGLEEDVSSGSPGEGSMDGPTPESESSSATVGARREKPGEVGLYPKLVFLAWSPHCLSAAFPSEFLAVLEESKQLEAYQDFDLGAGYWAPRASAFPFFQYVHQKGNSAYFRDALFRNMEYGIRCLMGFGKQPAEPLPPPTNYAEALERLFEVPPLQPGRVSVPPNSQHAVWRDVERFLDQDVIRPLREQALAEADPYSRTLILGFAELSSLVHLESLKTVDRLRRGLIGTFKGDPVGSAEALKSVLGLTDRLIKLSNAIQHCSHSHLTHHVKRIETRAIPHLPQWD